MTILILSASVLSGCGEDPARSAVAAAFEDAGSARFQSVRERGAHVCGEVNGRGRDGAYVGYRRFVYDAAAGAALIDPAVAGLAAESRASSAACAKPFAYQSVDERLACAGAPAARSDTIRQRRFEDLWRKACA